MSLNYSNYNGTHVGFNRDPYLNSSRKLSFSNQDPTLQNKIFGNIIKQAFLAAYNKSFNKKKIIVLTSILSVLSVIGSASNLLVLIVLALRDDCMNLDNKHIPAKSSHAEFKQGHVKFKMIKNLNKSTKPIYLLIQYLALVDFLTCSLAMPGTIVEIWNLEKWNETLCKLFEQLRATGFVLSNFIVVIISFERYMLLCKPFSFSKFKNVLFKKLLIIITIFSVIIGILSMLQVSVYQKIDNQIIFIGKFD
jgi:hypothetical protein